MGLKERMKELRVVYIIAPFLALVLISVMIFGTSEGDARSPHCEDCPSETCLCIRAITTDGEKWMLSPETGDEEEERK